MNILSEYILKGVPCIMNKNLKTEAVDHLFQAILTLKITDECYSFFEDCMHS